MMKWILAIFSMPICLFSQQIVDLCGNNKTFTYSTQVTGNADIKWYHNGNETINPTLTITWIQPGTYVIQADAVNSLCTGTGVEFTVIVKDCKHVWIPNTFTPNGDEFNSYWGPVFYPNPTAFYQFTLIVFNRWGNIVWISNNPSAKWDGTYNNKPVTDGVYTWRLTYTDSETLNYHDSHGHVTIIR